MTIAHGGRRFVAACVDHGLALACRALGLTQEEFARAYGIPVATLRDWEQGRRRPDQASKTLLKLIERMPYEVREALASGTKSSHPRG
jgi:putative transcriptional regulator